ncbi:HAD family hydrolase [Stomatohabitans albus]|uniref:HAD family hydrolase n=1 Tax=Stomatohabitans albus TaxID=3110766 RepID=UPI00300C47E9
MATPDLIVFDVDGTLLDEGVEVPERTEALLRLSQRVPCLLSSGRAPFSLARWARAWNLNGPHGACNGALLTTANEDIDVLATLDDDLRDGLIDALLARDLPILVFLADGSLRTPVHDERVQVVTAFDEPMPVVGGLDTAPTVKVITVATRDDEGDELRSLFADRTLYQRTHELFVEWNSPRSSKGLALEHQIAALGITPNLVYAVGDSENDASMLRLADHGIAVQGAAIEAREAADEHLTVPIEQWMDSIG